MVNYKSPEEKIVKNLSDLYFVVEGSEKRIFSNASLRF